MLKIFLDYLFAQRRAKLAEIKSIETTIEELQSLVEIAQASRKDIDPREAYKILVNGMIDITESGPK